MPLTIDYTGYKIGKLTILYKTGKSRHGNIWKYICECGNEGEICTAYIKRVDHHSCGCGSAFNQNPRVKNHTLLKAHGAMMKRCYDESDVNYHNYGGRGVKVCDRWHDYDNFYDDMIATWKKGLQLDKDIIPRNLGIEALIYCPDYCCWVSNTENARTRRGVKLNMGLANEIRVSRLSIYDLSIKHKVHIETIRSIKNNKTWV